MQPRSRLCLILSDNISVVQGINSKDMMILSIEWLIKPAMLLLIKGYIIVVTLKYISRQQNQQANYLAG
jgi:hypothetical protein